MADEKEQVLRLIEQPLANAGAEIADMALSKYKHNVTLRVYVYAEGGVSLDRCAEYSRLIGDIIDGTDLFERGYTLEVSSPGLTRPLTSLRDFRYRVGETVRVDFVERGRKRMTAEIVATTDNGVRFRTDDDEITVGMDEIERAKIVL